MIFLTVGTQVPFDRLVAAVDDWACARGRDDIVAQIGASAYVARGISTVDFLSPQRFEQVQRDCAVIVAHAGLGSILSALQLGKPIIILARDHHRGEHRNGHQMATIEHFADRPGVYPARDEASVMALLDRADELRPGPIVSDAAPAEFIERLRAHLLAPPRQTPLRRLLRGLWG